MQTSNIKVIDENNEGEGICKIDNIVTFVSYTMKGEIIDLEIIKKNKSFYEGKVKNIKIFSSNRVYPKCKYYYKCGGCNLMHESYNYQLTFKKNKVINNLRKIGNIELSDIEIISKEEYKYRNHITVNVKDNLMGFYHNNTNDIIDIDKCIISNDKINKCLDEIRTFINKYRNNNIERISIKAYNKTLINITSNNFKLINEFKDIVNYDSLYINTKYVYGLKYVTNNIANIKYKVGTLSFFQKNDDIAHIMYDYIKSLIHNNPNLLDLYCGVGSIGIYVSDICKSVVGIEEIDEAVQYASENALLNKVNNIKFISGRVENNLDSLSNIDTIIVDPPRVGLNKKAVENIIKINSKEIIYVSCNSSTLARDLKLLSDNYNLESIKLFDMFPHTYHVECVSVLHRKTIEK